MHVYLCVGQVACGFMCTTAFSCIANTCRLLRIYTLLAGHGLSDLEPHPRNLHYSVYTDGCLSQQS